MRIYYIAFVALAVQSVAGFVPISFTLPSSHRIIRHLSNSEGIETAMAQEQRLDVDPTVSQKFKILTCSSTACSARRQALTLSEYATFSAFWERIQNRAPEIKIEECPCLGSCRQAPCVAIEHDDFEGTVALEGMDDLEFSARVFHKVVDENDADRVWSCVENAILLMAAEENEDE